MQSSDPKRITRDALLALFAGLSLSACSKTESTATAEKPSPVAPTASAVAPKPAVSATEIAKPAASAEKDGSCAPGGCSPGQCGGAKK